jgi:hypothetical protein
MRVLRVHIAPLTLKIWDDLCKQVEVFVSPNRGEGISTDDVLFVQCKSSKGGSSFAMRHTAKEEPLRQRAHVHSQFISFVIFFFFTCSLTLFTSKILRVVRSTVLADFRGETPVRGGKGYSIFCQGLASKYTLFTRNGSFLTAIR